MANLFNIHNWLFPWENKYLSDELSHVSDGIKIEPENASNYLLAGRIHLIRGDYEAGLKIFQQGVSTATSDDPQRTDLKEWMANAKTCIRHRVDIVSQSPYDVFSNIARRLTQKGLQECIGVCRVWRSRIFEDPGAWRNITITRHTYDSPLQILPLVCHHIEELTIELDRSYIILKCLEVLESYDFSNIRSFYEHESGRSFLDPKFKYVRDLSDVSDRIYRVLENIGKRLTNLELGPETESSSTISLERVLPTCQNLSEFRCKATYITGPSSGIWPTGITVLTRLHLISLKIYYSALEPVLRSSPQLEELIVDGCEEDITPIFEHNCSRLTLLGINVCPKASILNVARRNSGDGRLRHLFISRTPSSRCLFSLLNRNARSLETLRIDYSKGTPEDWQPISKFTAPNVKHLTLYLSDQATQYHAVDILKSHSHINRLELQALDDEEIGLELTENPNTGSLLGAIIGIRNLFELHLESVRIRGKWVDRLLEYYAAQGHDASLKRFAMNDCHFLGRGAYLSITFSATKIASLTHLSLTGETYEQISESDIVDLAIRVGKMQKLSVFVLHTKKFSVDAARCIISSTSLKYIYFETVTQWTSRSLRDVVDNKAMRLLRSHGIHVATFTDEI